MIEAAGLLVLCNRDEKLAYEFIRQVAKATMERISASRSAISRRTLNDTFLDQDTV